MKRIDEARRTQMHILIGYLELLEDTSLSEYQRQCLSQMRRAVLGLVEHLPPNRAKRTTRLTA